MQLSISNKLTIQGAVPSFIEAIKTRLTFQNPAWLENEKQGRWNGSTPKILRYYEEGNSGLEVPRGLIRQAIGIARRAGLTYHVEDQRRILPSVNFTFTGKLRPFQDQAAKEMLGHDFGTLSAPTGSGKTVMACAMIAQRRQPTLIIVHTKELLNQWIERIGQFLGIPSAEIGRIGDGERTAGPRVTVALVQTLYKCASEVAQGIGFLIIDECHRTPSRTFIEAVSVFDSKYMLGLSATPYRRDGLSRLIFWHVGDVVHTIDSAGLIEDGDILRAEVIVRETSFQTTIAEPWNMYSQLLCELTQDTERNTLIAQDVAKEASNGGGACLVLSDRKEHCRALQYLLERQGIQASLLVGDLQKDERREVVKGLNAGKVKVLVATGQLIGEGFDCKALSTLFLATPIKFDGRVLQYLGRILRPAPGKEKAKVYDYVDRVGVLKASARSRQKVFEKNSGGSLRG